MGNHYSPDWRGDTPHRFPLGRVSVEAEALDALQRQDYSPDDLLARHERGDHGEFVTEGEAADNTEAIERRGVVTSVYALESGGRLLVVTDLAAGRTIMALVSE